jgi:hypothetical protein
MTLKEKKKSEMENPGKIGDLLLPLQTSLEYQ